MRAPNTSSAVSEFVADVSACRAPFQQVSSLVSICGGTDEHLSLEQDYSPSLCVRLGWEKEGGEKGKVMM